MGATGVPAHLLCPSRAHGLEEKVQSGPHSRPCRLALTSQCGYGLPGAVCQKKKAGRERKKKSKARMKEILNSLTDKMEGKLKSSWEGLWWKILLNLLQNRAWSTITLWSCFLLMMEGRRLYLEHVITPVMFPKTQAGYIEKLNGTFCINVRKVMNSPFLTISLFWGVARSDPSSFLNVFASFFPWQLHAKRTFHLLTCRASVQNQRNHERPKRHTQGHTEAG